MNNGVPIEILNAYIIGIEIIAEIIWQTYNAKRKEPLKSRYRIIMWSLIAFCVYLPDFINTEHQITGIKIMGLMGVSALAGLMLGYVADLIVYIGISAFNCIYKSIKKK